MRLNRSLNLILGLFLVSGTISCTITGTGTDTNANDNGAVDNTNDNGTDANANDNSTDANANDNGTDANANDNSSGILGDSVAGASVYSSNGCNICHADDGSGPPNILGEDFATLEERVRDGLDHLGGAYPDLTDQDLADLQAFLAQ